MMQNNVDIKLTKNTQGYYDIDLDDQGDLAKVKGMETALLMSLFCEKRADKSEVADPRNQRGWWGNLMSPIENYQIGSKLWLLIDQARINFDTLANAISYVEDGLSWLLEDGFADRIEVTGRVSSQRDTIYIDIVIYRPQNIILNFSFDIWAATQVTTNAN